MPALYVIEVGSRIEVEYERLLVTLEDRIIFRVPLGQVSQVVLVGRIGATTPALHCLLERDIPLFFLSRRGEYLGRLVGPTGTNLPLRQAQYQRDQDAEFCLKTAQAIVGGKLRNQYTLAARWLRRHPNPLCNSALEDLRTAIVQVSEAEGLDVLLGIEGSAARAYFSIYRSLFDQAWNFTNRNRRPPRDPINALLGLGYTLLHCCLTTAIETAGLDPYLGYYHTESNARPALALDLEEEFRSPIVDSLIYDLIAHRMIKLDDFVPDRESGYLAWLKAPARRLFIQQFSRKIQSGLKTREIGRKLSYQKIFEVQARRMAHAITGESPDYQAFEAR